MSNFIIKPNLPEGMVSALICGGLNAELINFFRSRDIDIFFSDENKTADKAVSKHVDLAALYVGDGRIVVDKGQKRLISELISSGLSVCESSSEVTGNYPDDCILNHTIIGSSIIGNSRLFDESVKAECKSLSLIHTNQGYCKCSVLVVDDNSVITDDVSIARVSAKTGINCLLISKGDVFLDGHEYGFIGGTGGKISKDEIIFFGDITKHRDYEKIKQFLTERNIKTISFDFPLTDFGGIIPLKEKDL